MVLQGGVNADVNKAAVIFAIGGGSLSLVSITLPVFHPVSSVE